MGLFDRVAALFRPRAPAAPLMLRAPGAGAQTIGEALASASGSSTLGRRSDAAVLAAYGRHPWLHIVVKRRAEAIGSLQWRLWRRKKGRRGAALGRVRAMPDGFERTSELARLAQEQVIEEVLDHAVLDLMENPSPSTGITGPAFWQLVSAYLDLVGGAPLVIERARAGGLPEELSPLVPTWITKTPVKGRPYYEVQRGGRTVRVHAGDMVMLKQLDPADPFGRGLGTARVLADEIETDEYMAATAKARFFNRALPDVIISMLGLDGQKPNQASADRLKTEIENEHGGIDRAGRFHVVGSKLELHDLGHTFQETQYVQGRQFLRDMNVQGFGTPPEVVGVLENSNKGTIHAAAEHFARYSTMPTAEIIRAGLQVALVDEFGEDLELDYVSPIPSDDEAERKMMIALPGAATINEVRKRQGLEPRKDGDVYMKAPGAPSIPIPGEPPKKFGGAPKTDDDDKETDDA